MSTIAAAATEEEAPNTSPETIQDNYHKMSRADLISKLISQELDLMTSKDVSPEAAKDRIDQLCVQINQTRTKFNKLRTRNMPPSSSAIAAGNGDPELERYLQLLNKVVSVLKSMFPLCLFKKPNTTDPLINWRDRSTPHFVSSAPDKSVSLDRLDKLDLQCVPETVKHDWLNPANFRKLTKLYIRGGRFCDLGQQYRTSKIWRWSVEILRLKHLENLEMDYRVLQCLFPNLICLETVKCPNLKNFPCNDSVWKDTTR